MNREGSVLEVPEGGAAPPLSVANRVNDEWRAAMRKAREDKGMSQRDLAVALGSRQKMVSDIEIGRTAFPTKMLQICSTLGIDPPKRGGRLTVDPVGKRQSYTAQRRGARGFSAKSRVAKTDSGKRDVVAGSSIDPRAARFLALAQEAGLLTDGDNVEQRWVTAGRLFRNNNPEWFMRVIDLIEVYLKQPSRRKP